MLLINVLIKNLMKKVKITKNSTPVSDLLLHILTSNSSLIQMFLSFCIKVIVTLFLIYNSLILFSHKNLSSHKKSFSSQQEQSNVNYSQGVLCLLFICTSGCQETKSNTCNHWNFSSEILDSRF